MNEDRLREAYSAALGSGKVRAAGGRHPSPEAIAALARREGGETERLATLDHVMSCPECRADFDLLHAVERAGAESGAARRGARRSWYVSAALAASVLLALGVGRMMTTSGGDDVTRGGEPGALSLLMPRTEAVAGNALTFVWSSAPGARKYALEVLDAGGGVVLAAETPDTAVSPALAAGLAAGNYTWWVRATTSDARTVRSAVRPLRLTTK